MENKQIYKAISAVMAEIGAVGKDRKNPQQGYQFRGIDDIYNAVNSALTKHGVFCVPYVENFQREEKQSVKGGTLIYTILTMQYTFYASDGSSITVRTIGEAMDSGDKSCNKAMSMAQKYAFIQLFCIPTEEQKDTEYESHEIASSSNVIKNAMLERISQISNIHELRSWYKKHEQEISQLSQEHRNEILSTLSNLKKQFKEKEGNHAN